MTTALNPNQPKDGKLGRPRTGGIRHVVHTFSLAIMALAVFFFVLYSCCGLMFAGKVEANLETKLILAADEPERFDMPARDFLATDIPLALAKDLFAVRQSMEFMVASGAVFLFATVLGRLSRSK